MLVQTAKTRNEAKKARKEKAAEEKKAFTQLTPAKFALAVPKPKDVNFEPLANAGASRKAKVLFPVGSP